MHDNVLICGETGSTKSNTTLLLTQGEQRIILDIQKNSTAWNGFRQTGGIYEDLDSQNGLPLKIDFQSARDREELIETLLDSRHSAGIDFHPQLSTVTDWFLQLIPVHWDMRKALRIFRRGNEYKEAISLAGRDVRQWWSTQPAGAAWERITSPTERLCQILGKPAIASRISQDDLFIQAINDGQSYYVDGGRVITDAEVRLILKWRLKQILRYKKEGGKQPLTIILEESEAAGIVSPQFINALLTLRKTGVKFVIVCQEPNWGDERTNEAVLQNTNHIWHRIGGEPTAQTAARDLVAMLNPRAIKEIQERFVRLGDQQFIETRNVFFTIQEQEKRIMQWLMNLQAGQAFSRSGSDVRFLQLPEVTISHREPSQLPHLNWEEQENRQSGNSSTAAPSPLNKPSDSDISKTTRPGLGGLFDSQES